MAKGSGSGEAPYVASSRQEARRGEREAGDEAPEGDSAAVLADVLGRVAAVLEFVHQEVRAVYRDGASVLLACVHPSGNGWWTRRRSVRR